MKILICAIALAVSMARMNAAVFNLDGDLSWEITEPRCTFKLDGDLQNVSPYGSTSGTIKLFLWATPVPYPSPGYIVGECQLGTINGGSQFSDFKVTSKSKVPAISGDFHFTIVVSEYTGAGWRNLLLVRTGTKSLRSGDFADQKKWTIPSVPVIAPPVTLSPGKALKLTMKATSEFNLFPSTSQERTTLGVRSARRLVAKTATTRVRVPYTYEVRRRLFKDAKAPCGVLSVNYPSDSGNADTTITLFFQTGTSGIYKSVGADTTWGTFTYL